MADIPDHVPTWQQRVDEKLLAAVAGGTLADVQRRLIEVADINLLDDSGGNLLQRAAIHDPDKSVAIFLLEAGLSMQFRSEHGIAALHAFAGSGWDDLVLLALEAGLPVDTPDEDGLTPPNARGAASISARREATFRRSCPNWVEGDSARLTEPERPSLFCLT